MFSSFKSTISWTLSSVLYLTILGCGIIKTPANTPQPDSVDTSKTSQELPVHPPETIRPEIPLPVHQERPSSKPQPEPKALNSVSSKWLPLNFLSTTPKIQGTCKVEQVFSGPAGHSVNLSDCKGNLGFNSKLLKVEASRTVLMELACNRGVLRRVSIYQEVLALMQTAEMAYLFNRRLGIQLETQDGNPLFFSLAEPIVPECH